jgi:hypothetical protein
VSGYDTVRLEDLRREDGWAPIRLALDVRSFGINSWAGQAAGDVIIPEHDEVPTGHEELYLVTAGHATFAVAGDEVDAPIGTVVLVRDPALSRGAVAREPGTTVLTVGAKPGEAFVPRAWEADRDVLSHLEAGRPEEAKRLVTEALDHYEDKGVLLYNLACAEALLGESDEALAHLSEAMASEPSAAAWAREDEDFASIRDDPRFSVIVG